MPLIAFPSLAAAAALAAPAQAPDLKAPALAAFMDRHCVECHDAEMKKGGLDLTALTFDPADTKNFATWVKVHDRVKEGEMPPKKQARPAAPELETFLKSLSVPMLAADQKRATVEGRATWRRMNRHEYENTLRDLLHAPWLQIKDMLPEDGEAHRYNKTGDALDVSHVQMARYLGAADYALRQVSRQAPPSSVKREKYFARSQSAFVRRMTFTKFNRSPERTTIPLLGNQPQPEVLAGMAPVTVGNSNKKLREEEAFGVVASTYEPLEIKFDSFEAPGPGRYRIKLCAFSFWAGADKEKWWRPDREKAYPGRRAEPVTLYGESPPRLLRWLGTFDATPEPAVHEMEVYLLKGETIRPDAARLFRSRPPAFHNPLAEPDGQPGVAFRWLEVEGPLYDAWPTAGHKLLFGDLPMRMRKSGVLDVTTLDARKDAEPLLRAFLARACRRPLQDDDVARFLPVIHKALDSGSTFEDAMIAGYTAVLCSPQFVCLEERPSRLDDHALAARLSYFLWNSAPDAALRALADAGSLHDPATLREQTDRLLADAKSRRFVDAFLDYWLDLRRANATSPDATLYPDYYLDDLLVESATQETQHFFAELLRANLPARHLVASDFAMLNEKLADHYGLPGVSGVKLRRVDLPKDSVRGGLLTQASVLKVTANGTTTSPVLRGAWVMERIIGRPPPPPPPSVPAVEPDTRGATTIREQLDKHRNQESCAACHAKIDPAGFALENFDVMGGWRNSYRALGEGTPAAGFGKNGQPFTFHPAQAVDASGTLPDGRPFADIRSLKQLLLADEEQLARNLIRQLVTYATGAPVSFGDRPEVERILEQTEAEKYRVRSLVHEIVQSPLFQNK